MAARAIRAAERAVLGVIMTAIAIFAERRLRRAIRKSR
jgi:hypothetical protein